MCVGLRVPFLSCRALPLPSFRMRVPFPSSLASLVERENELGRVILEDYQLVLCVVALAEEH